MTCAPSGSFQPLLVSPSLQSMVGACASFFYQYISVEGLKTALHMQDLVEFCGVVRFSENSCK